MNDAILTVLAIVAIAAVVAGVSGKKMKLSTEDIVLLVLAVILPPLPVFLRVGIGTHFWLSMLLTFFCAWLPGVGHAIWVVLRDGKGIESCESTE